MLAEEVRQMRESHVPFVLAHETDEEAGGCTFKRVYEATPADLISAGLYSTIVTGLMPGAHRQV